MTKDLHQLSLDAEIRLRDDRSTVVLALSRAAVSDFTLGLCLLKEKLVGALRLSAANTKTILELRRGSVVHRAESRASTDGVSLELSDTELGYWLRFFLKYVRDGKADVDHLDVEVDSHHPAILKTLVIKVPDSAPAVTPEEARRRLGL